MNTRSLFGAVGHSGTAFVRHLGALGCLLADTARWAFAPPVRGKRLRREPYAAQMVRVGIRGMPIVFMVLFFGIAAKEITEACLPGGNLNPLRKAVNPLFATVGGVVGPVACFFLGLYWKRLSPRTALAGSLPPWAKLKRAGSRVLTSAPYTISESRLRARMVLGPTPFMPSSVRKSWGCRS